MIIISLTEIATTIIINLQLYLAILDVIRSFAIAIYAGWHNICRNGLIWRHRTPVVKSLNEIVVSDFHSYSLIDLNAKVPKNCALVTQRIVWLRARHAQMIVFAMVQWWTARNKILTLFPPMFPSLLLNCKHLFYIVHF